LRSDVTRLRAALERTAGHPRQDNLPRLGHNLLTHLSGELRQNNWAVRVALRGDEIVAALPPATPARPAPPLLGLAVDVGTTKVAAYLLDLENGQTLAKTGAMNPQIAFGEDGQPHRYANANQDGGRTLQERLVATEPDGGGNVRQSSQAGLSASPEQVVEAVVVGNTAMHHFCRPAVTCWALRRTWLQYLKPGYPPRLLAEAVARAYVHLPPNIAGYGRRP
jgi:hypothetical protein